MPFCYQLLLFQLDIVQLQLCYITQNVLAQLLGKLELHLCNHEQLMDYKQFSYVVFRKQGLVKELLIIKILYMGEVG